jgi:hypothetical protein
MEISADPAGVARDRCEHGHSGKLVWTIEATHVAAGDREKFRTEQRPKPGEALDDG